MIHTTCTLFDHGGIAWATIVSDSPPPQMGLRKLIQGFRDAEGRIPTWPSELTLTHKVRPPCDSRYRLHFAGRIRCESHPTRAMDPEDADFCQFPGPG